MEKFENAFVKVLNIIYKDIEKEYKKKGMDYTAAEVYEKACKLMQELLSAADPESEWEISPTYDSMQDLYEKNK